jgi:hypothetical protein
MLTRWVSEGFAQGASFVYALPDTTPGTLSVSTVLADGGMDIDQAKDDGRVVKLPRTHVYTAGAPARIVAAVNAEGFDTDRIAAEARSALKALNHQAYLAYEWELVHVCGASALSALFQLDPGETREWFTEVSPMHVGDGAESSFWAVPGDRDVMLFGEVDVANSDRWRRLSAGRGTSPGGCIASTWTGCPS